LAGRNSERPGVEGGQPSSPGSSSPKTLNDQLKALKEQAERCRRLAEATYDRDVAAMLGNMAEGYERTARALSQKGPG